MLEHISQFAIQALSAVANRATLARDRVSVIVSPSDRFKGDDKRNAQGFSLETEVYVNECIPPVSKYKINITFEQVGDAAAEITVTIGTSILAKKTVNLDFGFVRSSSGPYRRY